MLASLNDEYFVGLPYLLQIGAILVFVSGWEEISKLNSNMTAHQFFKSGEFTAFGVVDVSIL